MRSSLPLVSVVIPTYNQSNFIVNTIRSVMEQDYNNIEIIVSDDDSSDSTIDVIRSLMHKIPDNNIKLFKNKENLGILPHYYDCLFNKAQGEWVLMLDGDDFLINKSFVSSAIKMAMSDLLIAMVVANYCEYHERLDEFLCFTNKKLESIVSDSEFYEMFSRKLIKFNHDTVLYKRELAKEVEFYHDSEASKYRNDWESLLRLAINNRVGLLNMNSTAWRQHEKNNTKDTDLHKYINNHATINNIACYATEKGMNNDFIKKWKSKMNYKLAYEACAAYILDYDYNGLFLYLLELRNISKKVIIFLLITPSVYIRILLSTTPSLYTAIKRIVYHK